MVLSKEFLEADPTRNSSKLAPAKSLVFAHDQMLSRIKTKTRRVRTAPCKLRCFIKQASYVPQTLSGLGTLVPNVRFCEGLTSQDVQVVEDSFVIRHNHKKRGPRVMCLIAHYQSGNAW